MLHARVVPPSGPDTELVDTRAAYDALDDATKAEVEDLICEHSLIYSRGLLGFADFEENEKAAFAPVRQRLVRSHPVTGRNIESLTLHISHAPRTMPMQAGGSIRRT